MFCLPVEKEFDNIWCIKWVRLLPEEIYLIQYWRSTIYYTILGIVLYMVWEIVGEGGLNLDFKVYT